MYMELEGARPKRNPRKTRLEVVKDGMKGLNLHALEEEVCGGHVLDNVNLELPCMGYFPGLVS